MILAEPTINFNWHHFSVNTGNLSMKFKFENNKATSVIQAEQPCHYLWIKQLLYKGLHYVKSVRIRRFSDLYFPAFALNTGIYRVSLRIQFECGKMWTRKTPNITDIIELSNHSLNFASISNSSLINKN